MKALPAAERVRAEVAEAFSPQLRPASRDAQTEEGDADAGGGDEEDALAPPAARVAE